MAIKGNGEGGDNFFHFVPAGQPQGLSSSRSSRAAGDCCQPVPSLGRGTNSASATSLLRTFVRDVESHFKTMKTCQPEDFDCFIV